MTLSTDDQQERMPTAPELDEGSRNKATEYCHKIIKISGIRTRCIHF